MRIPFSIFSLIFVLTLTGCSQALYLSKLGWHQGFILHQSIPVEEILKAEGTDPRVKEKIRFIQEVKHYGEDRIGLRKTESYSKFFEVKDSILYVVTACERDRLELHSWDFPIVGRVTYKGFFTREEALKEKRLLDKKSYDTFVQRAGACSTLGWFKDPRTSNGSMRNGLSKPMGFTAPISGPSFTATWTVGFFITALPGSDMENAVMNIFWPPLVSAGTSALPVIRNGSWSLENGSVRRSSRPFPTGTLHLQHSKDSPSVFPL